MCCCGRRRARGREEPEGTTSRAINARFAKGEIDKAQFEEKRKILGRQ
jgi:uncharacterized membrane protein